MCCPVSADSGLCDRIQRRVVMYDGRMMTVNGSTSAWLGLLVIDIDIKELGRRKLKQKLEDKRKAVCL